ncbi:MAG: GNAT family N-acetyltransferase [Actinobacteria bacterium]|nr:GNAT family N-acetyltransferase [Actinomycetota bacterium]
MTPRAADVAIRAAEPDDADALWAIFEPTLRAGETYAIDQDVSRHDALGWWLRLAHEVHVATIDDRVVGTYFLVRNHDGPGSHVANAAYVVGPDARGRGVGRTLCAHSLDRARERGFTAMQFNFVVSTNTAAVELWRAMGFEIVGRIPDAFDHPTRGLVEAYVMHRFL